MTLLSRNILTRISVRAFNSGHLQIIFNNAIQKLAFDDVNPKSDSVFKQKSKIRKGEEIIHYYDRNLFASQFLEDLEAVGLNTATLIDQVTAHSNESLLVNFPNQIPGPEKSCIQGDKLKLNHEFQRLQQWSEDDAVHQHALLRMQFESTCDGTIEENYFKAFCWRENMPKSALIQVECIYSRLFSVQNLLDASSSPLFQKVVVCCWFPSCPLDRWAV
jgi:S-adenosylmethionine:diacylglycerol 3-amino-3-carboxypropyl transferase